MDVSNFSGLDLRLLRQQLLQELLLRPQSIHGPAHWARVEQIGRRLSAQSGADLLVVRLFALFHDCRRETDGEDPDHGRRGAERARELWGGLFQASDEQLRLLCEACEGHTDGCTSTEPTIGACWDADRLDLPRVGIIPESRLLSTHAAREHPMIQWATGLSRPEWRRR